MKIVIVTMSASAALASFSAAKADPAPIGALIVADIAPVSYGHSHDSYVEALSAIDLEKVKRRGDADDALRDAVPEASLRAFLLHNLVFEDEGPRWRINLEAIGNNTDALIDIPARSTGGNFARPSLFVVGGNSNYFGEIAIA